MDKYRSIFALDKLKELYTRYSLKPQVCGAQLMGNGNNQHGVAGGKNILKVLYKYRDPVLTKTITFQRTFLDRGEAMQEGQRFEQVGSPDEVLNDVVLRVESKDGRHTAILKTDSKANPKSEQQFIVLYDRNKVKKVIDVKKMLNDQMSVVENAYLASMVLNDDATVLLAVVMIDDKAKKDAKKEDKKDDVAEDIDLDAHKYRQTWGEKFVGIHHTSIAVIDLVKVKYVLLDRVGVTLAQPFFYQLPSTNGPKSLSVGCVGFREQPYRLGMIYCNNRQSALYAGQLPEGWCDGPSIEPEICYEGEVMAWSPRVHWSASTGFGSKVYFLEYAAGGAHDKSARLQQISMDSKKVTTIVDNKDNRKFTLKADGQVEYDPIGPIYCDQLPSECFSTDGGRILVNTDGPTQAIVYDVGLEDHSIRVIPSPIPNGSFSVVKVKHDVVMAIASAFNHLPQLFISKLPAAGEQYRWSLVEDKAVVKDEETKLDKIQFEVFTFPSRDYKDKHVSCFWITGSDAEVGKCATLACVHGGPHGAYPAQYFQALALYVELGLNVLLVNYVGSTGVDDDYVNSLLGNVGTTDSHDFCDAIEWTIKHKQIDRTRIILNGGSHGGFLVTSLCGQRPEMNWLACIARNPVIDLASMSAISDIPDWTVVEALGGVAPLPYEDIYARSIEVVSRMHAVSPIAHVKKVKTPTLLLLGKDDLRVPYSQGLLYHRLLEAQKIETRCLVYEDVHDLGKINVDLDCFLNIGAFISKHIYYDQQ